MGRSASWLEEMTMARSPAGESVITRAARVLEAFEHDRRVLTVAEIARKADVPVPTAHRLVAQLLEAGFLEREGPHRVRIGMRLWEIAVLGARALELREAAMPFLEEVHAKTQHHTQLAVLDRGEVLVIERLSARGALDGILAKAGRRVPAHAGAVGFVLMAHAGAWVQDEVLVAPLTRYNPRTPTDPDQLRKLWDAARRQGYAVCDGFVDARALSIAVPVTGADGGVVAALGAVVPSADAQPMALVSALLAAAQGIGRALRTPAPPGQTRMFRYAPAPPG
jgi:DNA-binding IclR family transcriptional regulator